MRASTQSKNSDKPADIFNEESTTQITKPVPYNMDVPAATSTAAAATVATTSTASQNNPDPFVIEASNTFPINPFLEMSVGEPGRLRRSRRRSGAFPYPSSVIGGVNDDGSQQILMGPELPTHFASASSFPPSSSTGFTQDTMNRDRYLTQQSMSRSVFNSFPDGSRSTGQPERNVEIFDINAQNQRLMMGRERTLVGSQQQPMDSRRGQPAKHAAEYFSHGPSVRKFKFPPMHPSVFDGRIENETEGLDTRSLTYHHSQRHYQQTQQQQHQHQQALLGPQSSQVEQTAGEAQGFSDSSVGIQDDEPLPFDG
jgi:hypothetical protein